MAVHLIQKKKERGQQKALCLSLLPLLSMKLQNVYQQKINGMYLERMWPILFLIKICRDELSLLSSQRFFKPRSHHGLYATQLNSATSCKSNQSEFRRNLPKLCDISQKANFRQYFDGPIVPISLKFRSNVRNFAWHFVLRTTKFHATVYLGSEIPWNIKTECG